MSSDLSARSLEVLKSIVHDYVASGEPVGSKTLARRDLDVSSATIRNVMADLETFGFLEKPHPSAGRVPTDKGYRHYVETCLKLREPPPRQRELIAKSLPTGAPSDELFEEASKVLHSLTRFAGVVAMPKPSQVALKRIEFIALREGRVLAVLITEAGTVLNKLIATEPPLGQDELTRASNYLNELLGSLPIESVPTRIREEMARERTEYDLLARRALELGGKAFENAPAKERVLIDGEAAVLQAPEFADAARLRALVRSLEEKEKLLALLDLALQAGQVRIFIGSESDFCQPASLSVVAAPYGAGAEVIGTLGVIGPTRMAYDKVASIVEYTARAVSRLIEGG